MKKKFRSILILLLTLIAVGGIGYVIYYTVSLEKNEDVYEEAREVAKENRRKSRRRPSLRSPSILKRYGK